MPTKVEKSVVVNVPVETVYNQWTQFEEFPHFMGGISQIQQLDDTTMRWVADIAGVRREWTARILEQVPNEKVSWAATEGATNAGAVYFSPAGAGQTNVRLELEYEPEGVLETVADKVGAVSRRVEADLNKFKSFIEDAGYASGAWRGTVPGAGGTPGVEAAAASQGDSGGAGVSAKTVIAGAAAAAGAAGLAAAAAKKASGGSESEATPSEAVTEVRVVETQAAVTPASDDPVVLEDSIPADASVPGDPGGPDPMRPLDPDTDTDRRI